MKPVRIGITCGDVNGIGPEVAWKAAVRKQSRDVSFIFIGPEPCLPPDCAGAAGDTGSVFSDCWMIPFRGTIRPGELTAEASRTAMDAVERAVRGCLEGTLDAVVTAPINKEGLALAGCLWPGHTEMIAAQTGTKRFGMMLCGGGLRVMLATRHLPLCKVSEALTRTAVLDAIELTSETLGWFGLPARRIAVCGLNPHAGDGGALGDEEGRVIRPAVEAARARGIDADGPLPADAVFFRALKENYDAVVAMYHDQGLGPLKTVAFDCGINLTAGLPIVRTSPDHGTAFKIAGKGVANPDSMAAAIETAVQLAGRKNPWKNGEEG